MKAECVICMDHFQSSDAISASECGHVFHEACITRWLDEGVGGVFLSYGHCPQCRGLISKMRLVRLFFTAADDDDDTSTARVNHQRDIDQLKEQIALANKRVAELTDDCRHKQYLVVALGTECRQTKSKIADLTDASERKDATIAEQAARVNQLNKTLE